MEILKSRADLRAEIARLRKEREKLRKAVYDAQYTLRNEMYDRRVNVTLAICDDVLNEVSDDGE